VFKIQTLIHSNENHKSNTQGIEKT